MSDAIKTILISHSSKDKNYVEQIVKVIEVLTKETNIQIICSSIPGRSIPGDQNIYDFLERELKKDIWVVYFLSDNYYKSAASLNEMGATWVLKKKYSAFLAPNFEFKDIQGAIDANKISYKLNEKTQINDFKKVLLDELNLKNVDDNIWESVRDSALDEIVKIANQEKSELEKKKSFNVEYIGVKKTEERGIQVILRCINNTKFNMELNYFKITLTDIEGNVFFQEVEPIDITLNSEENRLYSLKFALEKSLYSASKHDNEKIEDIRFQNIHLGGL